MTEAIASDNIFDIDRLAVHFPIRTGVLGLGKAAVRAIDGLSLQVRRGETLAVVGESGCGKSTLARALMGLNRPTSGSIRFRPAGGSTGAEGVELTAASRDEWRQVRRKVQIVFQDPFSSLSPKQRIGQTIAEPLLVNLGGKREDHHRRAGDLLERVGLSRRDFDRFPHEFSGGQRQRIMIARAIALNPEVLIADEAISALDVSIRVQIINLLNELKADLGLTLIFISHDLGAVRVISDRIAIMYLGRLVEIGENEDIFARSRHPYTRMLLRSTPVPDPDGRLEHTGAFGELPSPISPPSGCVFNPRCPMADAQCRSTEPAMRIMTVSQQSRCHYAEKVV